MDWCNVPRRAEMVSQAHLAVLAVSLLLDSALGDKTKNCEIAGRFGQPRPPIPA